MKPHILPILILSQTPSPIVPPFTAWGTFHESLSMCHYTMSLEHKKVQDKDEGAQSQWRSYTSTWVENEKDCTEYCGKWDISRIKLPWAWRGRVGRSISVLTKDSMMVWGVKSKGSPQAKVEMEQLNSQEYQEERRATGEWASLGMHQCWMWGWCGWYRVWGKESGAGWASRVNWGYKQKRPKLESRSPGLEEFQCHPIGDKEPLEVF